MTQTIIDASLFGTNCGNGADLLRQFSSFKEMAEYIQTPGNVDFVDAVFCDPLGTWHHCTFAPSQCKEDDLRDGFPFDGSSIRLFKSIEESDMIMMPDYTTCWIDPFYKHKVLHVTCSITTPNYPAQGFSRCPRSICKRSIDFLTSTGIADVAYFGPEPEFFIFDDIKFCVKPNKVSVEIDGLAAPWNHDREYETKNLGHRLNLKQFYFPTPPIDITHDIRGDMLLTMNRVGIPIEKHHHEVAVCQSELGITCRPMLQSADHIMSYKYIVKNVAKIHNKTVTFMAKPIGGDNGSGMHVHQSLWKNNRNLFFDPNGQYCKLSKTCLNYIGGLLHHAPSVLAFTSPTVNSYKRLVPGYEAPVNLVYAKGNRSAAIRIPLYRPNEEKSKRLEFRCPDPACCPYIAYAAMLMAGISGIKNNIDCGNPCDIDLYELSCEEKKKIKLKSTPASLLEAIEALEVDHEFLLQGNVFTKDFIQSYIAYKKAEHHSVSIIPHPKEFDLYYAC